MHTIKKGMRSNRLIRQEGVSLVEIAAVLVIFSILTASAVAFFNSANQNVLTDDAVIELHTLRENIDSYLNAKGDAIGLNTKEIAQSGRIPERWVKGTSLSNPFRGDVSINPYSAYSYSVAFNHVTADACMRLLAVDMTPGLQKVYTQNGQSTAVGRALSPTEANTLCLPGGNDGTSTITWIFGDTTAKLPGAIALSNPVQAQNNPGNHINKPGNTATVIPYNATTGTTYKNYISTTRDGTPPGSTTTTTPSSGSGTSVPPVNNAGNGTPPPSTGSPGSTNTTTTPATPSSGNTTYVPPVYTNSTNSGGSNSTNTASSGSYSNGNTSTSAALGGTTPTQSNWDPAALGNANVTDGSFNFDSIGTNNWSGLNIASDNTFSSNGFIELSSFKDGSADSTPAGLAANQWSMVMAYTGNGTSTGQLAGSTDPAVGVAPVNLTYSSLNFSIYLIPNGDPVFNIGNGSVGSDLSSAYLLGTGLASNAGSKIDSYVATNSSTNSAAYGMDSLFTGTFGITDQVASTGFFGLNPQRSFNFTTAFSDTATTYAGSGQQATWSGGNNANTGSAVIK